jgi:acyl-CoA thioesterase
MLRALIEHPQASGDPLALTVNYCAPIAEGPFDLDVRLAKANRSSQHWFVELSQGRGDPASLATAVFAERRPSWSHQPAQMPATAPFGELKRYPDVEFPWAKQYEFRFAEGTPQLGPDPSGTPHSTLSKIWISDRKPRPVDMLSLMAMSDAYFARVFHARGELVPFGTVTLTTYFHVSREELASENITHLLLVVDAKVFNRSYCDQSGELWSPSGRLLATTTQMGYFKA